MYRALIVTAYIEHSCRQILKSINYDEVICADGGYKKASELGLHSDYLIGDYDSMEQPADKNCIVLPKEKDMTDTEAAIDYAVSKGNKMLYILGGLGGRFDHTMGNIGMLSKYCNTDVKIVICDDINCVFMSGPGTVRIPSNSYHYLGIISHSDKTENLSLKGVKYPLSNYQLENNTSLGVSNEITCDYAEVSFSSGKLLIILSNDSQDLK